MDTCWRLDNYHNDMVGLRKQFRITIDRTFTRYENGRLFNVAIGKNVLALVPQKVALFLNLENASSFTGHSIRRTSASVGAENGITALQLKELGGWKSDTVAASYIESSTRHRAEIASGLLPKMKEEHERSKQFYFNNLTNCTINLHFV